MIARAGWGVLAALGIATLLIAHALEPSPAGLGTHEALGLPPCGSRALFSLPCPGCGLTTAFSHLMRFELSAAVRANPAGVYLFVVNLILIALGALGALRGYCFKTVAASRITRLFAILTLVALFGGWMARLLWLSSGAVA
ncbi:MAG: DUF2752 domain-containing protein [Sandaracinaceae bacterium]|nr:DUF2752 domain-containing protein [Sandaracinaceae bacterium]